LNKDKTSKKVIKNLIKTISSLFLNLKVKNVKLLDKEFERIESKRADILALMDKKYILHIEIQTNYDKKMPIRMLRYYTDIKENYDYPIFQMVVFLGKGNLKNSLHDIGLDYSFRLLDMKKIDCEIFLNQNTPDALVLAILCDFKDKEPKNVIEYIIKGLLKLPKKEYRDYMLILEELSTLRDLKECIKEEEMILLDRVKYEDLPSYEIGLEKGMERGMEKGVVALYKVTKDIDYVVKEFGLKREKVIEILKNNGFKVENEKY